MIQTAEGGLSQVTDMVRRARDLTLQASKGISTYSDKKILTAELTQISEAVTNISKNTTFNNKTLLNGDKAEIKIKTGVNVDENISISLSSSDVSKLNIASGGLDVTDNTDDILKTLDAYLKTLT